MSRTSRRAARDLFKFIIILLIPTRDCCDPIVTPFRLLRESLSIHQFAFHRALRLSSFLPSSSSGRRGVDDLVHHASVLFGRPRAPTESSVWWHASDKRPRRDREKLRSKVIFHQIAEAAGGWAWPQTMLELDRVETPLLGPPHCAASSNLREFIYTKTHSSAARPE